MSSVGRHPRVIETHALRKQFGATLAVADLSLRVGAGEIFGFLGPNGAGKTTSIKMLLALVEPTSGTGHVLGAPLGDRAARARIGFLPEHFRFHDTLTATELLRFHGRLYGLRGVDAGRPHRSAVDTRGPARRRRSPAARLQQGHGCSGSGWRRRC